MEYEVVYIFLTLFSIYLTGLFYYLLTVKEKYVRIIKKYTRKINDNKTYLILDNSGNRYRIGPCIWILHFYYDDIYDKIEENKQYKIKYYGLDINQLNWIPNIIFISE